MTNTTRGKALVADDHGLYRTGLAFLLRDQLGYAEIIEVAGFDEALDRLAIDPEIELALFDLSMPGMGGGPDTLVIVRETYPALKIAVVSASEDRGHVLAVLAAGLGGYVPKSLPDDEIVAALEWVLAGKVYVPTFMAHPAPGQRYAPPAAVDPRPAHALKLDDLTQRQRDVLNLVLKGLSNKEIARQLEIAEGTVKIHLSALFSQLGARNRTDLAARSQILFGPDIGR